MPVGFWAEAVTSAADIRNRIICPCSDPETCYELLIGHKPCVDAIRLFGSLAWSLVRKETHRKLDRKGSKGVIIVCYENDVYRLWITDRKTPVLSRHVRIRVIHFPPPSWYGFFPHSAALFKKENAAQSRVLNNVPTPRNECTEREAVQTLLLHKKI